MQPVVRPKPRLKTLLAAIITIAHDQDKLVSAHVTQARYLGQVIDAGVDDIVAATRNAAHVCGLEKALGTLEAGKFADILVVSRDPLQDLVALTQVQMVIHNGVVILPEDSLTP